MNTVTKNFRKAGRRTRTNATKAPRPNRELKAQMELAGVDVRFVSKKTEISYARCSEIISGARRHPEKFKAIWDFVFALPTH